MHSLDAKGGFAFYKLANVGNFLLLGNPYQLYVCRLTRMRSKGTFLVF